MRPSSLIAAAAVALSALAAAAPLQAEPGHAPHGAAPHTHGPDSIALDRRGRTPAATYDVDAHAPWSPSEWDGAAYTTDRPDLTELPTVHAIYLYPSNGANRITQFAAMFQADARASAGLLGYGRSVRFDERLGADGTTRYLDITVVKSSNNARKLGAGSQFNLVRDELVRRGFTDPDKKYVVWLDAASNYCGQGELYQQTVRSSANYNERRTTAIVYRPYATTNGEGGFCRGRTLLHELGHNFGALQRVAPHAFDGAHCNDSAEDVMCYTSATSSDTGGPVFDHLNDDYWDPAAAGTGATAKLPWWTTNLSRFLCPTATTCDQPNAPGY